MDLTTIIRIVVLGTVVYGVVEGLKRTPLGAKTWFKAILPLLPIVLGALLGAPLCTVFEETLTYSLYLGAAGGVLSAVCYSVLGRTFAAAKPKLKAAPQSTEAPKDEA